ncbi:hypothetical protein Leryth_010667 [Lithospermum erythrorhizon]|nr:hypothetical protein Leryth_010667 [Lithospermum erythrorhizon]
MMDDELDEMAGRHTASSDSHTLGGAAGIAAASATSLDASFSSYWNHDNKHNDMDIK